jgi:signal transduction histidine kinase
VAASLKRTNDHKAEVLGTVAHDLKNPLGVILGRSEMMNELASASTRRTSTAPAARSSRSAPPSPA